MAPVTLTMNVVNVVGASDDTVFTFSSVVHSSDGVTMVTDSPVYASPIRGILTVQLEPGFAQVDFHDQTIGFTVPSSDGELWPLLEAGIAVPPNTSVEQLATAVNAYLTENPPAPIDPAALQADIGAFQRRPLRNTFAAIGDSMTAIGSINGWQPALSASYFYQLQLLTHQRMRYCSGMYAVGGTLMPQQLSDQLPEILAMNPLPGACMIAGGAGDVTNNGTYNFATQVSIFKSMVSQLLTVGIVPILFCLPANQYIAGVNSIPQIQIYIHQWNTFIRRYAAQNGFALVDGYTATAAVDGTWSNINATVATTAAGQYLHPSPIGHRLIAEQALADGLADLFPPNSLVNTARTTDDLSNMFNNGTLNLGLFTTNSSGVGTGMTASNTGAGGTVSIVAPVPVDKLMGNWQQLTIAAKNIAQTVTAPMSTGWSVGDTIAFSFRCQTENMELTNTTYSVLMRLSTPSGYPIVNSTLTLLPCGADQWTHDITDGEVYVEFAIPQQATSAIIMISVFGGPNVGTAKLRVGELTVRNLTTGGFLP